MEDGRFPLPPFFPDARYSLPHPLLRPGFDIPQDPRLAISHPPPLDFRSNGDLALDRFLRREGHPEFRQEFYPLDSPNFGGFECRNWGSPPQEPFFDPRGFAGERVPAEARLWPPRGRIEEGVWRRKRNRVVDEFVDGDGSRHFMVSSTDSHGVPIRPTANHGYNKGYRDNSGSGDQYERHPSACNGKKNGFGGNSYNTHKVSSLTSKNKMSKSAAPITKRVKYNDEPRKGLVAAQSSEANEGQKSSIGDSEAEKTVDLDISFKSNALIAKEVVVPRDRNLNSSKVTPTKKKVNKTKSKKVKKLKQAKKLVSPIPGTPVPVLPKKTVKRSVGSFILTSVTSDPKEDDFLNSPNGTTSSNNTVVAVGASRLDLVSEDLRDGRPKKDELYSSSNGTTLSNVTVVVVEASRPDLVSEDLGDGRNAVGSSDGDAKPLVLDSEKGGRAFDMHELCGKGVESDQKSDFASSVSLDDVPLSSIEDQLDDAVCRRREAETDGAVRWQPASKEVKGNPPCGTVDIDTSDHKIKLSPELIRIANIEEDHIAPVVSERSTQETIYADNGMYDLNPQTFASDDMEETKPEDSGPPVKKLKTHDGTALVADVFASKSLPKLLQVETGDAHKSKKVSTEETVLDAALPLSLHAGELKSNPSGMTAQSVPTGTNQAMAKPKIVRESANKNLHNVTVPPSLSQRAFPPPPSLIKSTKATLAARVMTSRTWRRTDSTTTSTSTGQLVTSHSTQGKESLKKQAVNQNSSYIRKGNSLVRKTMAPGAITVGSSSLGPPLSQLNVIAKLCSGTGSPDRGDGSIGRDPSLKNKISAVSSLASENDDPIERPDTPPLAQAAKLPVNSPQGSPLPELLEQPPEIGLGICTLLGLDSMKRSESNTVPAIDAQNDCSPVISSEHQGNNKIETSETKQMIYVKTRVNQLIARPSSKAREILQATAGTVSCRSYYKKNKNQLLRESPSMQPMVVPDDGSNSEEKGSLKPHAHKHYGFNKRKINRVSELQDGNFIKASKVWFLNETQSQLKEGISMRKRVVLPSLVPWKRKTYHSFYGRKLQLSCQRDTLYTISGNGYSLQKSAVVSIGGRSLKWSKSIEKRTKQACEEATLAFAAVEKEKRKKGVVAVAKTIKHMSRRHACGIELKPGERVFRVASVRYKMDSSRRTLLRIPDEKVSSSVDQASETGTKKLFVPRRLLIGNNEYIRIGNGNKLVKDPKRLTRMLASEKVKWSLHNVRSRLARKKQYCQFFTRFGRCNKGDGKCPYIHDPDKVAVCTKFLKGSCFNENCKLTHKVIPERMPDCSFFIQGLCSNGSCPYRHVNVNPAASICEGFLKGYCARGDQCDKKHNHTCPQYEATGTCKQRSMCKLHHPKKKHNAGKLLRQKDQEKTKHRYFGLSLVHLEKPRIIEFKEETVEKISEAAFISNGKFVDCISLDVDGEEAVQENDLPGSDAETSVHDIIVDSPKSNLDMLIKPIGLMQRVQNEDLESQSLWSYSATYKGVS